MENAVTALSNSLNGDYQIEIVSVYQRYDTPVFKLNKNIEVKYLITHPDIKVLKNKNIFKLFKTIVLRIKNKFTEKKLVKNFLINCNSDIIISTNIKYNYLVGKYANKKILKIGWEHSFHDNNKHYITKAINSVRRLDYFILVSESMREFYAKKMDDCECRCLYIPNPLEKIPDKISSLESKNILTIGKLAKEKGYVDLIEIFKYVSLKYPDWKLNIIGDGPERKAIEERIRVYKLENNVIVHGFKDKKYISKMFENSSIYVMSSSSDAFGIVILEAFSYGIPCVAFDTSIGAKELISNNWDGYLVSDFDKDKMTKKIIDLIKNENRRIIMGNNAHKKSLKYTSDIIKEKWLEILN